MATFECVAVDKAGKQQKRTFEATNEERAKDFLKSEGLIPISVKEQSFLSKDISFGSKRVKPRDLSIFCRQFNSVLGAGVTILSALQMLSEQTENKVLREAIKQVQIDVEKGESLTQAMAKHKETFPPLLVHMVEAGEASGSLEIAFSRMAIQFEKQAKLQGTIKKAMVYPAVVITVAVAVVILMLIVVFPQFQDMFDQLDSDLPVITKVVIAMSNFVQSFWFILVFLVFAAIVGVQSFKKTPNGQLLFSRLALHMPVIGNVTNKSASATLARTLSTLLAAGIPLVDAVEITAKVVSNVIIQSALDECTDEIKRGVPLSTPLQDSGVFPPMVYQMTRIGEETGNVEGMLEKIADYYEEEVETATAAMTALLEPMIIVVLGLLIGFILVAIYMPMLGMYSAIDKG